MGGEMDIKKIPIETLQKDRQESLDDIKTCEKALELGIITYSGGSTRQRLDTNTLIVVKIDNELTRREK